MLAENYTYKAGPSNPDVLWGQGINGPGTKEGRPFWLELNLGSGKSFGHEFAP